MGESTLLDYENQMFLDCFHEDGLLITAKGLGLERIMAGFIRVYCDPSSLVIVLNNTSSEEQYFIEQLECVGVKCPPKVITTEYSANDRQSVYLQGGVLFVTSRILVVDFLTDRVPVDHLAGILVYKAHRIVESCQEAFILRLYRQRNKNGFIKAFSDRPLSFTTGFCQVERVMKAVFVRKLYLWPRFHADVVACLDQHKVDVVEVQLHLTPMMTACQAAILDLINAYVKELRRCSPILETDDITVENALTRSFDKVIKQQLDPILHQLGSKVRTLVADIRTLRLILKYLTQYDCVTFYNLVNSIRTSEKTFGDNSGWLFLDAADTLYVHAKERVLGNIAKKSKTSENKETEPPLEENPKWTALSEILEEIREENAKGDDKGNVLITAEDDRTCSQIKEYLLEGSRNLLVKLYNKDVAAPGAFLKQSDAADKPISKGKDECKGKGKGEGKSKRKSNTSKPSTELTLTQMVGEAHPALDVNAASCDNTYYGLLPSPITLIHPLHSNDDTTALIRTLHELQPRFVVLYDPDMQFVRQLELYEQGNGRTGCMSYQIACSLRATPSVVMFSNEQDASHHHQFISKAERTAIIRAAWLSGRTRIKVFKASRPGVPLRVYFIMYIGSTEEQRYLTTITKEKDAFSMLIKEKASMVIPENIDGRDEHNERLERGDASASTVNTRKGGVAKDAAHKKVIVDMREFRSELPSLIHKRGIDIEPVTLEVGDYILTPDMCVERKSVSDLIGSLQNGRLYNQCVSMCRCYRRPVLLIEFDANKSFSLQSKFGLSSDVSINDTTSKLALITLHFPKLRILWCQSPYATAELFEELKAGHEEPDVAAAAAMTTVDDSIELSARYSHAPQDLLLKIPGINTKNCRRVMNTVCDIAELCTYSEEQLTSLLDNSANAKLVHEFLHMSAEQAAKSVGKTKQSAKYGNKPWKRK